MAAMLDVSGMLGKCPYEPMGQLEPQLCAILRGRIKHYSREYKCTSILVTPDQLKFWLANLFTGTFIGEPPMNVLNAKVQTTAEDLYIFDLEAGNALSHAGVAT